MTETSNSKRIAIVGAGISGLAAAHRITELAPSADLQLFEASDRVGGTIQTTREDGYLIEHSADNFLHDPKTPWAVDLCRRISFESELIETDPTNRRAFIWFRDQLHAVPEGFRLMAPSRWGPIFRSSLLSASGKVRLFAEPSISARACKDEESLESFAVRRLGRQAFDRLVQPLVAGIYTADPAKLSVHAALPQFVKMEQTHGSLAKAVQSRAPAANEKNVSNQSASGARYALFVAPKQGMGSLVDHIAKRLPDGSIHLGHRVQAISRLDDRWQLTCEGKPAQQFDAVVFACSAAMVSRLLEPTDKPLAEDLRGIEFATSSVFCFGVKRKQIAHPLNGFGVVVPAVEKRSVLAASFASVKFPDRAPEDSVLIRVFVGGALRPDMAEASEPELHYLVLEDLRAMIGLTGEPEFAKVVRWPHAMPQYNLGHIARRERIERSFEGLSGIEFCGNSLHGVGIPQCIRSGEVAAEKILCE